MCLRLEQVQLMKRGSIFSRVYIAQKKATRPKMAGNIKIVSSDTNLSKVCENISALQKINGEKKHTERLQQKGKGVWIRWAGLVIFSTQQGKSNKCYGSDDENTPKSAQD